MNREFVSDKAVESMLKYAAKAFPPSGEMKASVRAALQGRMADEGTSDEAAGDSYLPQSGKRRPALPWFVKLAAGILIVCGILGVIMWANSNGHHIVPSAYAELAEAVENSKKAEWVHVRIRDIHEDLERDEEDEEVELWISFKPHRVFVRTETKLEAMNFTARRKWTYDTEERTLQVQPIWDLHDSGIPSISGHKNFYDFMMAHIERDAIEVARRSETVNGRVKTVIEAKDESQETIYVIDKQRKRIEGVTVIAAGVMPPVVVRLEIDYPDTGPKDVYALGVPRDAEVVDLTPVPDAEALKEKVERAAGEFPGEYFAVICKRLKSYDIKGGVPAIKASVTLMHFKDGVERRDVYELTSPNGTRYSESLTYHERFWKTLPAEDMAALEAWAAQRLPTKIVFYDGRTRTTLRLDASEKLKREVRQKRADIALAPAGLNLWQLPIVLKFGSMLDAKEGEWGQLVGMESYYSKYEDWYFNPQRDYVCEFYEKGCDPERVAQSIRMEGDGFVLKRLEVLDYAKTAEGRWYPKTILDTRDSPDGEGGYAGFTYISVIHLDTKRAIPDELLDPDSVTGDVIGK